MPRKIKSGLIQMSLPLTEGEGTIQEIKEAMVQKHLPMIEDAGKKGVQILCQTGHSSASTERITFLTLQVSGKNFSSNPVISVILYFRLSTAKSEFISATTDIFRKAQEYSV